MNVLTIPTATTNTLEKIEHDLLFADGVLELLLKDPSINEGENVIVVSRLKEIVRNSHYALENIITKLNQTDAGENNERTA